MNDGVPVGNVTDKYGSGNPVVRRLMRGFFGALDEAMADAAPTRVVEVGTGEGEVARRVYDRWPGVPFVGIDLRDETLAGHWRQSELLGCFADASRLPVASGSVDLVLAIEVLEHVPQPAAVLEEIRRIARPTARVVLSVPNEPTWRVANVARGRYLRAWGNTPGHINHWSRSAFESLVSAHLQVEQVWSPFPWTVVRARP